ncbi:MAG: orotate phosphoribosyltransferase [Clostridia bacterium]|nr:orotate phosphoribosyltransferase [Clostridia bacterium]MBQ7304871.1 orotate phosphoribosyltransferase [Clostridia bacterium]MBQ7845979.1 orotate phosphoribosyltransferase [Clostridia bacterium]
MAIQLFDLPNTSSNVRLRLAKGHFATSHSHINYYIDLTMTKHRLSEAREAAAALCASFRAAQVIDTILCLDGTEVIGACMASELTRAGFSNMNAHRTIYVVTPEHTSGSQLIFRDNTAPMIVGKHVLVLAASVTTGYTAQAAIEAIRYYSGKPVGICSIFSCVDECAGFPVVSIFTKKDHLDDYQSCPSTDCPLCKAGVKLDGMVNSHGISTFR